MDPKLPRNVMGAADFSDEWTAETTSDSDLGGGEERGWTRTETFMPLEHPPMPQMKKYLFDLSSKMKSFPLLQFPSAPSVVQLLYPILFTCNTLCWVFWYLNAATKQEKVKWAIILTFETKK